LKFEKAQLKLVNTSIENDANFCDKLISTLPDQPSFDESATANLKKYPQEVTWLKDAFKQKEKCQDQCIYTDVNDYQVKVKPGKKLFVLRVSLI
jgi:hypothetical protein